MKDTMKPRARDLNIQFGQLQPGPLNAITDVPGVRVGHSNVRGRTANGRDILTGVTIIEPRVGSTSQQPCFAGVHVLNGNGDATGLEWIREAGLLTSPIAFTNTHSLGVVRDALIVLDREQQPDDGRIYWNMPVVLETYDGLLNDINGFHVKHEHVAEALSNAVIGPVIEGAVGGGSGMICHEFKGGIGTASRRLSSTQGSWTVGAIVQANHGIRNELRVDGYPVGRYMEQADSPFLKASLPHPGMGSIVVCLATDAPLLPHQCTRLAQRASIGLARTGGGNEDHSGDIFIAFSTGNHVPPAAYESKRAPTTDNLSMVNNDHISELFLAATEAVEEAIINALLAADTAEGNGHAVPGLDCETLLKALHQAGWPGAANG
ncbi:D-aminopeptidase [Pseudomonas sp. XWY-1]|jgi:D-aminopeptidase|uniref:D-aminopeptidase n=3 Tax=Gammaproteobacteria TaxID=1236 RepID=Q88G81_PSEPK|nr:putative D-aminopeptidase [Pseudomonas putida KT2440]AUZ58708.1 D-aminopeptidase [Pseudomonas sp. XWY-1]SKC05588.1 D-aminopeptidase [Pseudomonas putida]SMQ00310.1 D-aminopeptidase [Pseudomonas putida]VEE40681.1 D-aminopeptidase [Pseudomonas putida]